MSLVGWCTCGNCRLCGYAWAQPVHTLTTTGTTFELGTPRMTRWLRSLSLPRFKLHADGSVTPLNGIQVRLL